MDTKYKRLDPNSSIAVALKILTKLKRSREKLAGGGSGTLDAIILVAKSGRPENAIRTLEEMRIAVQFSAEEHAQVALAIRLFQEKPPRATPTEVFFKMKEFAWLVTTGLATNTTIMYVNSLLPPIYFITLRSESHYGKIISKPRLLLKFN